MAIKLEKNLPEGRTYEYFMEEFNEKFSEKEKAMIQLPGQITSIEKDSTLQKVYHKSFLCFSMVRVAKYLMTNYTMLQVDSSFDADFDFVTGGDGREVYKWLENDYQRRKNLEIISLVIEILSLVHCCRIWYLRKRTKNSKPSWICFIYL